MLFCCVFIVFTFKKLEKTYWFDHYRRQFSHWVNQSYAPILFYFREQLDVH